MHTHPSLGVRKTRIETPAKPAFITGKHLLPTMNKLFTSLIVLSLFTSSAIADTDNNNTRPSNFSQSSDPKKPPYLPIFSTVHTQDGKLINCQTFTYNGVDTYCTSY